MKAYRLAQLVSARLALFNKVVAMSRFEPMFPIYLDAWRRINLKVRKLER